MRPSDVVSMVDGHLIYKGRYSHSDVSWTEGIVVLDGLSFDKLIRKLENAYGVDIVIDRETFLRWTASQAKSEFRTALTTP